MPQSADIKSNLDAGVMTFTLNRPQKKNALTQEMYRSLAHGLRLSDADDTVGAIILKGAPGAFCAGADLADFAHQPGAVKEPALELLRALASIETPLVAQIDGAAIGLGATMLLHCDFAFASPISQFQTPFIDLALCAEGGSSYLAPLRLGAPAARRLLLLGETLDAPEAAACGLITQMVDDPAWHARQVAQILARKPHEAMRATKRLLRQAQGDSVMAAIGRETDAFAELLQQAEAQKAIAQFLGDDHPETP